MLGSSVLTEAQLKDLAKRLFTEANRNQNNALSQAEFLTFFDIRRNQGGATPGAVPAHPATAKHPDPAAQGRGRDRAAGKTAALLLPSDGRRPMAVAPYANAENDTRWQGDGHRVTRSTGPLVKGRNSFYRGAPTCQHAAAE